MPTGDRGLTASALTASAGAFTLGPIDLAVPAGRVLVVLGPSGAGKSMLLETIAGLRPRQSGQIRLAGTDLASLPPERRRVGLVFQDAALFPHMTVRENIRFGPRASGRPYSNGVGHLLRQLGITELATRMPSSLSGGERQRVALARALAIRPRLLLLDEPLSALDQPTREDLRTLLQHLLADLDIPAIHVTHDRDEALTIGDDLALIVAGQHRQTGPAAHVTAHPADPDTARLLGWTHLGPGTAVSGTVHAGQLLLPDTAAGAAIHDSVQIYYRPEEVLLGPPAADAPAGATITAVVQQITPTRPLARVSLASDPPVTALILHRDLRYLDLQPGATTEATLPRGCVRIFPQRPGAG